MKMMGKSGVETDKGSNDNRETTEVMVPAGTRTSMKFKRWMEQGGELLPGMLDDITLNHISTKLSWRDVHVLSSVSPGWHKVLQSREIYDKRVDSDSTETLAVMSYRTFQKHYREDSVSLALYSVLDEYTYDLPPFPFGGGCRLGSKLVCLDHKIYVLGGRKHASQHTVCMLDLAEKRWKQCAIMREPRNYIFAAASLNGKIYVFGGRMVTSRDDDKDEARPTSVCQVYDPKIDAWSLMKPMPLCRAYHNVAVVGDELFVYGGSFVRDVTKPIDPHELPHVPNNMREPSVLAGMNSLCFLDVYHPVKDDWRRIVPSEVRNWDTVFTAREKFHQITEDGIEVYDLEQDLWSRVHTFHDAPYGSFAFNLSVMPGLALDDELLLEHSLSKGGCYQSKGFGSKNRAITWKKVKFSRTSDGHFRDMFPIQL